LTLCICDTPSCNLHDNQNNPFHALVLIFSVRFQRQRLCFFFFTLLPLFCIKKRRVGSLLCFFSFVISRIYVMKTWFASRHGIWIWMWNVHRYAFSSDVVVRWKDRDLSLVTWLTGFAVSFILASFLRGLSFWYCVPDWPILSESRVLEDMSMRRCNPPCICDVWLVSAFWFIYGSWMWRPSNMSERWLSLDLASLESIRLWRMPERKGRWNRIPLGSVT
jgi:hypothetical protein